MPTETILTIRKSTRVNSKRSKIENHNFSSIYNNYEGSSIGDNFVTSTIDKDKTWVKKFLRKNFFLKRSVHMERKTRVVGLEDNLDQGMHHKTH